VADAEFDIKALAEEAQVTPRTVHFYVQQGLLPPASSPGPGARYGEGHLSRLKLIRLLQNQHLPLAEIAKRLKGLTDEQVGALLAESRRERQSTTHKSALEYIRGVLAEGSAPAVGRSGIPAVASRWPLPGRSQQAPPGLSSPAAEPVRSQWERLMLIDGIELHVRRPLSRVQQRQLDKLMAAARTIFGPEGEE